MRIILLLLILTTLGCSNEETSNYKYELTIYFEGNSSEEIQKQVYDLADRYQIGNMTWRFDKPNHIEKFPTFFLLGTNGVFQTSDFDDLIQYLNKNN